MVSILKGYPRPHLAAASVVVVGTHFHHYTIKYTTHHYTGGVGAVAQLTSEKAVAEAYAGELKTALEEAYEYIEQLEEERWALCRVAPGVRLPTGFDRSRCWYRSDL